MQVAFLLPPDHGMNIADAAVSLVDGRTAQALTPGAVPLATLTLTPCTQPPPAALSSSLHRLLQEAGQVARSGATGGSSAPPSAGAPGTGSCTGGSGGAGSGSGVQLSQGLQLRRLVEHADRFEAELAVDASLGGTVSSSGMGLEFPGAPLGGGACQALKVRCRARAHARSPARLHAHKLQAQK